MTAPVPSATDVAHLPEGALFGPYRIGRPLGAGGMGAVYQATQLEDGREVALKLLAREVAGAAFQERFAREGRLAARLSHPNVVYVFRAETIEGHPAIAMELVPGGTLEERVAREGPLPVAEALRCILQVIEGLEAAHAAGILHRDIKPANCYLATDGVVKIGDFGLARPQASDDLQLTQQGMFLGTPSYASPEQLVGDPVDVRSDIYAVGATLHFLLTGKPRYDVDSAARLIALVMRGAPEDLAPMGPSVPAELQAVIHRCLARDAASRFQGYDDLREALRAFLPVPFAPAPLTRRLLASAFDFLTLSLVGMPFSMLSVTGVEHTLTALPAPRIELLVDTAIGCAMIALYHAISEGRWGASPGKWVMRLRLEDGVTGRTPGYGVTLRRALLFVLPFAVATGLLLLPGASPNPVVTALLPLVIQLAMLFGRARPGSGWLGEHERLTGTRVARVIDHARRAERLTAMHDMSAEPWDGARQYGPFEVLGRLPAPGLLLLGRDPALLRQVWIAPHAPGTPPLPAREREGMHPGHLRWIAGQRLADGGWDAYASPQGASLADRLRGHAPWNAVRGWLMDVAHALGARGEGDVAGLGGSPAHVWITDDGRALLLPFPVGASPGSATTSPPLLRGMVDAILAAEAARGGPLRWPARATRLLEAVRHGTPAEVRALLEADAGEPAVLTTQRRLVAWGLPVGIVALPSLIMASSAWTLVHTAHPETRALLPVATHLSNRRSQEGPPTAEDSLVAIYIGERLPRVMAIGRTAREESLEATLLKGDRAAFDSLIRVAERASPAQREAAVALVEGRWRGRPPEAVDMPAAQGLGLGAIAVALCAAVSLVGVLLGGRVPGLSILGLAVVKRDGHQAGRLRLLGRQAVAWGPMLGTAISIISAPAQQADLVAAIGCAGALVLAGAGLLTVMRTPHRGLADRLVGTMVVPD